MPKKIKIAEPPKIHKSSVEKGWLTVTPVDINLQRKLWEDFEIYNRPKETNKVKMLDMRWIDEIKSNPIFGYVENEELLLYMDDIGMVTRDKDAKEYNLKLDKGGYVMRRYNQIYGDDYYWKREECIYNDTIYNKKTGSKKIWGGLC